MIALIILTALVISYIILTVATWITQWGLEAIIEAASGTDVSLPHWPIFWILVVLGSITGGASRFGN